MRIRTLKPAPRLGLRAASERWFALSSAVELEKKT